MKVLDNRVYKNNDNVWFKVKLDRNTDVLCQELFTQSDIDEAKKAGVREFLDRLFADWSEK